MKNYKYPGPFTCKEDVPHFMKDCKDEKEKIDWLYVELRYAKASSGLGDNKNMFTLKKDGRNLAVKDYVDGLERHFEGEKGVTNISLADLKNILGGLECKK